MTRYLPLWRGGKDLLAYVLKDIAAKLAQEATIDCCGVTMTGELSDVFQSKREGVQYILQCAKESFPVGEILVLDLNGNMRPLREALDSPIDVAGVNWVATAKFLARRFKECVLIDVGSTTTDIIPVRGNVLAAEGRSDLERLSTGELVYTGALRSNVATIVDSIPIRGRMSGVSAEAFALTGDVHLLLANISPQEYSTETADGRGVSREECLARLARVVCADIETLEVEEILHMAEYIYGMQLEKIGRGLKQVLLRLPFEDLHKTVVVTAGLGGTFLGMKSASRIGFKEFYSLERAFGREGSVAAPAVATAFLAAAEKERDLSWSTW